ncbi:MAG: cupin domain-containing protein [Clostridia bacterium]
MIEQIFTLGNRTQHTIGAIIKDENIHYMHMVLLKDESLPTHFTNATVYMTVIKGTLSLRLSDGEFRTYEEGSILVIPFNTKMDAQNHNENTLELIVIKAPAPKK